MRQLLFCGGVPAEVDAGRAPCQGWTQVINRRSVVIVECVVPPETHRPVFAKSSRQLAIEQQGPIQSQVFSNATARFKLVIPFEFGAEDLTCIEIFER